MIQDLGPEMPDITHDILCAEGRMTWGSFLGERLSSVSKFKLCGYILERLNIQLWVCYGPEVMPDFWMPWKGILEQTVASEFIVKLVMYQSLEKMLFLAPVCQEK